MTVRSLSVVASILVVAGAAQAQQGSQDPDPFAVRVETYMGAIWADFPTGNDDQAFNWGGVGSATFVTGQLYLQADLFGDYAHDLFDEDISNVGGGGHIGFVDPDVGLFGISGVYQSIDDDTGLTGTDPEIARLGVETEFYTRPVTFAIQTGWLREAETDDDGYYFRGGLRYYPKPNLKVEGMGGVADIDDSFGLVRLLMEYRFESVPIGIFSRWEGAFDDDLDQNIATVGIRIYLDNAENLQQADRLYYRENCVNFNLGARTC